MTRDAGPFTAAYAIGAVCFAGGFILLAVVTLKVGDAINRHVQKALRDDEPRLLVREVETYLAEQARRVR